MTNDEIKKGFWAVLWLKLDQASKAMDYSEADYVEIRLRKVEERLSLLEKDKG